MRTMPSFTSMPRLGPLAKLPVCASDFASACFTASVPRQYLRLVIVRVIATDASGDIVTGRCRDTCFLIDARHDVPRLCAAARDAIRASRSSLERETIIDATAFFTRVAGALTVIDAHAPSLSVHEESVVVAGRLRGSLHVSGALRAYQTHCTVRSRVCVARAAAILATLPATPSSELADRFAAGLRRLGVAKPTRVVPDECACDGTAACSCFMARAMWRAGRSWMILYALLPPIADDGDRGPAPTRVTWLERLASASASESEDVADPLSTYVPSRWRGDATEYVGATTLVSVRDFAGALERLLASAAADDVDDGASTSDDEPPTPTPPTTPTFVEAALVYVLSRRSLVAQLGAVAKHLAFYHKTALEHVLATSRRRDLIMNTLRVAAAAPRADALLEVARSAPSGIGALVRLVPLLTSNTNVWQVARRTGRDSLALHACESTGYALVVAFALIATLEQLSTRLVRLVNPWSLYDFGIVL